MGSAGGGVWKATDGGERWTNVSDGSAGADLARFNAALRRAGRLPVAVPPVPRSR
jgi:photosystem II stability/assembly factor-like uncharacterized protein